MSVFLVLRKLRERDVYVGCSATERSAEGIKESYLDGLTKLNFDPELETTRHLEIVTVPCHHDGNTQPRTSVILVVGHYEFLGRTALKPLCCFSGFQVLMEDLVNRYRFGSSGASGELWNNANLMGSLKTHFRGFQFFEVHWERFAWCNAALQLPSLADWMVQLFRHRLVGEDGGLEEIKDLEEAIEDQQLDLLKSSPQST